MNGVSFIKYLVQILEVPPPPHTHTKTPGYGPEYATCGRANFEICNKKLQIQKYLDACAGSFAEPAWV